jgi:hypothetical protein
MIPTAIELQYTACEYIIIDDICADLDIKASEIESMRVKHGIIYVVTTDKRHLEYESRIEALDPDYTIPSKIRTLNGDFSEFAKNDEYDGYIPITKSDGLTFVLAVKGLDDLHPHPHASGKRYDRLVKCAVEWLANELKQHSIDEDVYETAKKEGTELAIEGIYYSVYTVKDVD